MDRNTMRNGLKFLAIATLAIWLSAATPAQALTPEERADIRTFVTGNVVFTLFHEAGHALIHLLDLPTLGREEDAADNLAALLMIGEPTKGADIKAGGNEEMLLAAADGWAMLHEKSKAAGEKPAFWDSHSLDQQRYHNVLCLIYGSNPEIFVEIIDAEELPAERREQCAEEYAKTADSWTQVLNPHLKRFGAGAKGKLKVAYDVPKGGANNKARNTLKSMKLEQLLARNITDVLALKSDLTLRFSNCDDANAHYDPETREIVMCYELVGSFTEMIEADLKRQ
jgi:hypothetical protein